MDVLFERRINQSDLTETQARTALPKQKRLLRPK